MSSLPPKERLPRSKLIQRAIVRGIEVHRRERDETLCNSFMIRILAPTPRDTCSGDPKVAPSVRIHLLDNGVVEASAA